MPYTSLLAEKAAYTCLLDTWNESVMWAQECGYDCHMSKGSLPLGLVPFLRASNNKLPTRCKFLQTGIPTHHSKGLEPGNYFKWHQRGQPVSFSSCYTLSHALNWKEFKGYEQMERQSSCQATALLLRLKGLIGNWAKHTALAFEVRLTEPH